MAGWLAALWGGMGGNGGGGMGVNGGGEMGMGEMRENGGGGGLGVGGPTPPTVLLPAEGREALLVSMWVGGDPRSPSHPGFIPFPYPRCHRGSARSRSPAFLALVLRVTRSPCPGGTWREGES